MTESDSLLLPESQDERTLSNLTLLCLAGVLTCAFFLVDHSLFASSYFLNMGEYSGSVNRTADRVEQINPVTVPVRIVLGMIGFAFLFVPSKRKLRWGGPILIAFMIYIGYFSASVAWSESPEVTMRKLLVLGVMIAAAIGFAKHASLHDIITVFTIVCVAYIIIGLLVEIALGNFKPHLPEYRFFGTCHPNSLAAYGTVCCLAAPIFSRHKQQLSALSWTLIAVGVIVLLATKSRTTLAGMIFAVLATRFITFKPNQRLLGISLVILCFLGVGFALALSRPSTWTDAGDTMAMGRTDDVTSLTGRLPLWEELYRSIEEKPIFGHGYLAYWQKERVEYLSDLLKWEIPHGHNMYLDVLLDGGVLGLIAFLIFYLTTLVVSFGRYLRHRDIGVAFVFGIIVFALVHGFAESLFKLPTFLMFIVVTVSLRLTMLPPVKTERVAPRARMNVEAGKLPPREPAIAE